MRVNINIILITLFIFTGCFTNNKNEIQGWEQKKVILERIIAPVFSDNEFNILNYGGRGDGKFDNNAIINEVIAECSKTSGGKVVIPAGNYLCNGSIRLKSNVNLHLEENAVIKFSTEPSHYLPVVLTRFEGIECYNYSPLVYAFEQENIAITGKGTFDGQATLQNWWPWVGVREFGWIKGMKSQDDSTSRPLLRKMNSTNVPVEKRIFGEGHHLRPNFVQPFRCKNILIEGVKFLDSPMWFIHPVECENIIISGVTVMGEGPNNDGCNPESCKDVLIKDCYFKTGDDCIAIKSGRNNDGRRIAKPSEDIVIQNCKMEDGHGGVVIGSEISGNCRNVFVEDCEMDSPLLDRAIRIKTNMHRGGIIENIFVRNIKVGEVAEAVLKINLKYDSTNEGPGGNFLPVVRNIIIQNVVSGKSKYGIYLDGLNDSKIENVRIENCIFNNVVSGNIINNIDGLHQNDFYINEVKQ